MQAKCSKVATRPRQLQEGSEAHKVCRPALILRAPHRLSYLRAFMMSCGDVMAEFFYIIVLLRNHVTCLIRFSADDHLVITP